MIDLVLGTDLLITQAHIGRDRRALALEAEKRDGIAVFSTGYRSVDQHFAGLHRAQTADAVESDFFHIATLLHIPHVRRFTFS